MKYVLKNNNQMLQDNKDRNNCSYIPKHYTRLIAVPGETGPTNIVETAYLYLTNHKPLIVEPLAIIPLSIYKLKKNIDFENDMITLTQKGKYLFNWNITVMNTSEKTQEIEIALVDSNNVAEPVFISKSGEKITVNGYAMLSGNAIIDIQTINRYYFINYSQQEITIDTLSAMISITQIA